MVKPGEAVSCPRATLAPREWTLPPSLPGCAALDQRGPIRRKSRHVMGKEEEAQDGRRHTREKEG